MRQRRFRVTVAPNQAGSRGAVSGVSYYSHPRPQMRRYVPLTARRVLDIGCGDGAFAEGLRDEFRSRGADLEVWGLELDIDAAARAATRLDHVVQGPAEASLDALPAARFDCIVMNDFLEHLVAPERLLRGLHRLLRPGAVIVASIPNIRYFPNLWDLVVRADWTPQDEGIRDRTHLWFFTRDTMCDLFAESGFRVVRQEGMNPTGSWRWHLWNIATLGRAGDTRFLQFACVAQPAEEATG